MPSSAVESGLRKLLSATACLCLTSCSAALNFTVPKNGYSVHHDIAYGTDPRQRLDIYVPDQRAPKMPVILFFYGGSWKSGSKDDYLFVGQALASKGFIAIIADYRLYPQAYFPDFVHDGASAFAWTHRHIADYGGDPKKLFLAGHSAGAFIAVMLSVNPEYLKTAHASPAWIRGTIGISGPYDFLPLTDPDVIATFSRVDLRTTQPINFLHGHMPPMLLVTGDGDNTVYPKNTINVAAKLRALRSPAKELHYPNVGHIGIIVSLASGFRGKTPLLEDIARFVHQQSGDLQ